MGLTKGAPYKGRVRGNTQNRGEAPRPTLIGASLSCRRAAATPSPPSKSAVADFDRFIEWPKPAYTRFRLGEGWGGGSGGCGNDVPPLATPTQEGRPLPSPQGGGEEFAALLRRKSASTSEELRPSTVHVVTEGRPFGSGFIHQPRVSSSRPRGNAIVPSSASGPPSTTAQ